MNAPKEAKPKSKLNLQSLQAKATGKKQYLWLVLLLFFVLLYGYMFMQISSLDRANPSTLQVSNDLKTTALPAINPSVVNQLNQLQNNSVSVQALFNQVRTNPFQ